MWLQTQGLKFGSRRHVIIHGCIILRLFDWCCTVFKMNVTRDRGTANQWTEEYAIILPCDHTLKDKKTYSYGISLYSTYVYLLPIQIVMTT